MPDTSPYYFELAQDVTNKFVERIDMQKMQADAIERGGLDRVARLIAKHRPNAAIPEPDWAVAIRGVESRGSGGDIAVGDPYDKTRAGEYDKLTFQEKYDRRDEFKSWGSMQIQEGVIKDVNTTFGTHYTHEDAFDRRKAVEIFHLYTARYKKKGATAHDIAVNWNRPKTDKDKESYLKKFDVNMQRVTRKR